MKFTDTFIFISFLLILNTILFCYYKKISRILNVYDKPDNKLKKHSNIAFPVGGIVFYLNLILILIYDLLNLKLNIFGLTDRSLIIFFLVFSGIFFLGFFDDKYNLNYKIKFFVLSIIIASALFFDENLQIKELRFSIIDLQISIDLIQIFISTFFILLFINALNMFDGINLQVGIYTLIICFFLYFLNPNIMIFLYLKIFLIFFLFFNNYKKVFLGNSGSMLISFFLSYYFIKYYNLNYFNYAENVYIFMCIPGLDMFRLFIERILKNKNPFKGDNNHIHHILFKNLGLLKTTIIIQFLIFISIVISYYYLNFSLFLSLIIYIFILSIYKNKKNKI